MKKYLGLLLFVIIGCVEPFNPGISDSSERFIVVDGSVTSLAEPAVVKLAWSGSYQEGESNAISGAIVKVIEENGPITSLIEHEPGVYRSVANVGDLGKRYQVSVDYQDKKYESTWEEILPCPLISDLNYQYFLTSVGKTDNVPTLQFYLNSDGRNYKAQHYRYELKESWKFKAAYPVLSRYIGNDEVEILEDPNYICWKNYEPSQIVLAVTTGLNENVVFQKPIHRSFGDDERFTLRYALHVRQLSMGEKEYNFWKNLKESTEELGNLFDKQPATAIGNLSNVNDPNELVLGFFSASGAQEKIVFVDALELPVDIQIRQKCIPPDTLKKNDPGLQLGYEATLWQMINSGKKLYYQPCYPEDSPNIAGALLVDLACGDCVYNGGTKTKPDFWDE